MPDGDNSQVKTGQGRFRMERIREEHGERAAAAVEKALAQSVARAAKATTFEKTHAAAEQAALLDLIRKNILSVLPPELRGLCENVPPSVSLTTANPHLVACLKPSATAGAGGGTYWGKSVSDGLGFTHALSLASVAGHRITCTGGEWYHRTTQYGFTDQTFWIGAEGGKAEEDIWLPDATVFVYVELPGQTWGYTTNSDDLQSGTTYLRRCIFSATILEGTASGIILRNSGDIHS